MSLKTVIILKLITVLVLFGIILYAIYYGFYLSSSPPKEIVWDCIPSAEYCTEIVPSVYSEKK